MAEKTIHVYHAGEAWAVKRIGVSARTFPTRRAAIAAAKHTARNRKTQFVIHGKDGRILGYGSYGIVKIQDPPKRSRNAVRIGRVVGARALDRVLSDAKTPREQPAQK